MNNEKPDFGKLKFGPSPNTLVLKIFEFVYSELPFWRDDCDHHVEDSEEKLSDQLYKFLNIYALEHSLTFYFGHEESQFGRHKADISALPREILIKANLYGKYDPIVVFECKRLPTPGQDREKEYVTGLTKKNGGIQRFKIGVHGAKQNIVAMIGYLQVNSPDYWFTMINKWITELNNGTITDICVWSSSEKLEKLEEDSKKGTSKCLSSHSRSGSKLSDNIAIHHFWVRMNSDTSNSDN
jgi:hypothetical protein